LSTVAPPSAQSPRPTAPASGPLTRYRDHFGAPGLIGVALMLAACDPASWPGVGWAVVVLVPLLTLLLTLWAAPAVVQRPFAYSGTWRAMAARHRNTLFAALCTVIAALGDPPVWLMAADAALLLAYLLAVDALTAGPIGARQLRGIRTPLTAAAACAAVLLVAEAPVDGGAVWGRIVAALAVAAAATAAGLALWIRVRHKD
jgi:hypothetical protein